MPELDGSPNLNVLLAGTPAVDEIDADLRRAVIDRLNRLENVSLLYIPDLKALPAEKHARSSILDPKYPPTWTNARDLVEQTVSNLCGWTDLLILFPFDADNMARMLHGMTDNTLLKILRSWDVTKKILLVPGMSTLMWENPMTKKQLSKIRRKWNWIRVTQPVLWTFEGSRKHLPWDGVEDLVESVRTQVDLKTIGHGINVSPGQAASVPATTGKKGPPLPPELWSMILDFTGDWELATALNVHTSLSVPLEWRQAVSEAGPQSFMDKLEWYLLTADMASVKPFLEENKPIRYLSRLCIKLIMRFGNIRLLSYLESSHKDLFWATFGHTFLPDKASSVFGRVEVLEYWRTSPSFLEKKYTAEAMDGASRSGFVHVLDWWQKSGLPLRYTEAALEQASSSGHINVLEWWKIAADLHCGDSSHPGTPVSGESPHVRPVSYQRPPAIRLKPGKSISYATQSGSLPVLKWWANSGIPFHHEETLAKLASTHGHVHLLEYWHSLRGEKMLFDNQVLVGATKMGHRDVLEWWKRSGLRVEYKTCDIEEALEDGDEGPRGEEVKRWWARNGLNLGVGTTEWMMTKQLRSEP
jgi:hypothetical protein